MHSVDSDASLNKMTNNGGYEIFEYNKPSAIEPFSLINEVKKHPILYNKQLPECSKVLPKDKEKVWDLINAVIFPNYNELNEETKEIIKITVRKRWKSLRDAFVKDHRFRCEHPERRSKQMTDTINALQFLRPHIKYPRTYMNNLNGNHSPDFCQNQNSQNSSNGQINYLDDDDDDDEILTNEALYPSVHLTILAESGCEEVEWNDGFCISGANTRTYNNSAVNYTITEVEEPELTNKTKNFQNQKRTPSENNLLSKLNELIDRGTKDSHDEDRMFLMSLLSDFKRVPVDKKLKVKSAFVTALYEALK